MASEINSKHIIILDDKNYEWFKDLIIKVKYLLDTNPKDYDEFNQYFDAIVSAFNTSDIEFRKKQKAITSSGKKNKSIKTTKKVIKKKKKVIPTKCGVHPSYKGLRRPRNKCSTCYDIWAAKWPERDLEWKKNKYE